MQLIFDLKCFTSVFTTHEICIGIYNIVNM